MLVLSRKMGEKIIIGMPGATVVVTVVQIVPGKIRLGIDAPQDISIFREELLEKKKENSESEPE